MQDVQQTDIRADYEPDAAEEHDGDVFPQDPVVLAQLVGPESDDLDERRKDERQRGTAESSD